MNNIYGLTLKSALYSTELFPSGRTEWQDGWNACYEDICLRTQCMIKWIANLSEKNRKALLELLEERAINLEYGDSGVEVYVNMNDTWGYACADSEEVPVDELPKVLYAWKNYEGDGLTAWAALKTGYKPIEPLLTDKYYEAHTKIAAYKEPE